MYNKTFEIRISKAYKEYFVLIAGNYEIILVSEEYESRQSLKKGIASIRLNVLRPAAFKRFVGTDGQYYFNLWGLNNKIIGASEAYTSVWGREIGITSVRLNALIASVTIAK